MKNHRYTGKDAACQVCFRIVPLLKNDPADGDSFAYYARHRVVPSDPYTPMRSQPFCAGGGYYLGTGPETEPSDG